ncbi:PREDICTED: dual specificity protein phosphatase 9 [Elephantulus edwardii]|uniref:dual specificity protein phosphatase 9 n=1 Tax=Elephantulus edwardii TaxID=28737 RepID=UPI0003F0924B|nr:PREDICTED: dual specificity protein phosphatase 9 [Elephantulus edwardii]
MEDLGRSCLWLSQELEALKPLLLLLDCRTRELYESAHITGALNVALPALLMRRVRKGSLSVRSLLPGPPFQTLPPAQVILYGQGRKQRRDGQTEAEWEAEAAKEREAESVVSTLLQKLREEGCMAYYLQGGFSQFQTMYPHLCEARMQNEGGAQAAQASPPAPVVGLGTLFLSSETPNTNSEQERQPANDCQQSRGTTPPPRGLLPPFPVQIVPNLYLGTAQDSANLENLATLGIRYILNVTPNHPNLFEKNGVFHYKQIPISDHWSQNLSQFFPEAITFIEEGLARNCGVLVHCLAGVSRSVTVIVAYLMQKQHLCLNDAYDLVKTKKANISPNFNFMGQLLDFERRLRKERSLSRAGDSGGQESTPSDNAPSFFTSPPQQPCL